MTMQEISDEDACSHATAQLGEDLKPIRFEPLENKYVPARVPACVPARLLAHESSMRIYAQRNKTMNMLQWLF